MSKKLFYVFIFLLLAFYAASGYCEEASLDKKILSDSGSKNALRENELLAPVQSKYLIYKSKIEDEKIGLIESVNENEIIINLGKNLYVTPGMEFKAFRKEKRIELPEAGESALIGEYYIATLKVIDVDEEKSRCKVIHLEPTDNIMVADKVVSVPGTGYEEILKQRETDKKALDVFLQAKKASRSSKESAIALYKQILNNFPQSAYAQAAQDELDRYERIAHNQAYQFKRIRSFSPGKNNTSSVSKDIAVDSEGNIWLLNSKKVKIEKYSANGELLITLERRNKFGREIMRRPTNITLDEDDNIYVLDPGLKNVSKFNKNGGFINDYFPQKSQKPLVKPIDIAVSSNQDVFILDAGTSKVLAFNKDNKFWASFGDFNVSFTRTPDLIAIDTDEDDNIYVLDKGTKYLYKFSRDLRLEKKVPITKIFQPIDMVTAFNRVYILDKQTCSAIAYDTAERKITKSYGAKGRGHGRFSDVSGMSIDSDANIYICDGNNYSFQKFSPEAAFIFKLNDSQITKVSSLAVNDSDNLYLLNAKSGEYQEFDKYGRALKQVFLKSEFQTPSEIVIDFQSNVYILDTRGCKVHKFSPKGEFLTSFGSKAMFKSPVDICVDRHSNIYILDDKEFTVKKFDAGGNFLKSFGQKLTKKRKQTAGHFKKPKNIAINSKGIVFVLDKALKKIFEFDSNTGDFILSFRKTDKNFLKPSDIAVDGLGFIYIADAKDNNIYKFQDDGTLIQSIITAESKKLQIRSISSICVDGSGSVYALDSTANQIFEFKQ